MSILVVLGHPSPESFNATLAAAYIEGARAAGASVSLLELGALTFDPVLHSADQPLEPDLVGAQAAIEAARHIVWVSPVWWVGLPALLKGFIDRTLLSGWAFHIKSNGLPEGLLSGRSARVVLTMDAPGWWYRMANRRAVYRSFVGGTLKFCGLGPIRQTTIFQTRTLKAPDRVAWLERLRKQGASDAARLQ